MEDGDCVWRNDRVIAKKESYKETEEDCREMWKFPDSPLCVLSYKKETLFVDYAEKVHCEICLYMIK